MKPLLYPRLLPRLRLLLLLLLLPKPLPLKLLPLKLLPLKLLLLKLLSLLPVANLEFSDGNDDVGNAAVLGKYDDLVALPEFEPVSKSCFGDADAAARRGVSVNFIAPDCSSFMLLDVLPPACGCDDAGRGES